jgi:hypothetical protein
VGKFTIRFNKKHTGPHDVWRIFEGEKQHNVEHFVIDVPVRSNTTFEEGEMKWNITCEGILEIMDGTAHITKGIL